MARWKIINKDKAEELGIEEAPLDSEGFIVVNEANVPKGLSVKNMIAFAEKEGIILKYSKGEGG